MVTQQRRKENKKIQTVMYFLLTNIVEKILKKEAIINGLKAPGLLNLDLIK